MTNFRKVLLVSALILSSFTVSAQNRTGDDDSTRVGLGFNNSIADEPSDPNSAVIAPMYCPNQSVSWGVGANNCTGTANTANPGVSRTVTATGVNTGSATFTCSAATNTFTGPNAGATCVAPPPPPVPAQGFQRVGPLTFIVNSGINQGGHCGDGYVLLNNSTRDYVISGLGATTFVSGNPIGTPGFLYITNLASGARVSAAYSNIYTGQQINFSTPITIRAGQSYLVENSRNNPYGSCSTRPHQPVFDGNPLRGNIYLSSGQVVSF